MDLKSIVFKNEEGHKNAYGWIRKTMTNAK